MKSFCGKRDVFDCAWIRAEDSRTPVGTCRTRRKKSDYNSKNTGHVFVAGFVLPILIKNSYILSRDPFMLKSKNFHAFREVAITYYES